MFLFYCACRFCAVSSIISLYNPTHVVAMRVVFFGTYTNGVELGRLADHPC